MIVRVQKRRRQRFVVLSAKTVQNAALSWEALGLWAYLMSMPDNWQVNHRYLASLRKAGRDKILRILKELETAGLLQRQRVQDPETGRFQWISIVYEEPHKDPQPQPQPQPQSEDSQQKIAESPCTENPDMVPCTDLPCTDFPCTDFPCTANPDSITNIQGTNIQGTNIQGTSIYDDGGGGTSLEDTDPLFSHLVKLIESNIGPLSPLIADEVAATVDEVRAAGGNCAWLDQAVAAAVRNNKRSWAYVRRVLENACKARVPPVENGRRLNDWYEKRKGGRKSKSKSESFEPPQVPDVLEVYDGLAEILETGSDLPDSGDAEGDHAQALDLGAGRGSTGSWF